MDMLVLFGIVLLNVLISVWNCYAVGTAWKDTMAMGGWFNKLLLWSGVIQSGVGFSMPILLVLAFGTVTYLTTGDAESPPTMTPEEAAQFMQQIFSLWYVAVIFPILGSGLAIWAHSLRIAYQRRDFASIATAGWNSFAQIHNTVSAVRNLGGALGDVGSIFDGLGSAGSGSKKGNAAVLLIVIVVISLVGGFMIAFGLVKYFARNSEARIETYANSLDRSAKGDDQYGRRWLR